MASCVRCGAGVPGEDSDGLCATCEENAYDCGRCGKTLDVREGEPVGQGYDQSSGLPVLWCPGCLADLDKSMGQR